MIKLNEYSRIDILNKIISALDNENIPYSLKGKYNKDIVVSKSDLDRASKLARKVAPELNTMSVIDKDYVVVCSKQ